MYELNGENLQRQTIEYLTMIFHDFSISFTDVEVEKPFFRFPESILDRNTWYHFFNDNGQLIVSLNANGFSKEKILFNMMHLLIHEINRAENIVDISAKSKKYHMKNFRITAEKLGVKCVLEKNYGFVLSEFSQEAREIGMRIIDRYYDELKECSELLIIANENAKFRYKRNAALFTYQCPICHKRIKASENTHVLCGNDGGVFERI